ncbi:hypothetical protein BpHYR1_018369 [Brachionus plicatilis]|uniref:Uncharacterized protein n=1 Tax=Brachionus plicatilis TaxID=10195 RepID=A0A3M7PBD4_BRAPC|nr:hypothetical protein BpHYR1_018369 [Brachionus plicatilis]
MVSIAEKICLNPTKNSRKKLENLFLVLRVNKILAQLDKLNMKRIHLGKISLKKYGLSRYDRFY